MNNTIRLIVCTMMVIMSAYGQKKFDYANKAPAERKVSFSFTNFEDNVNIVMHVEKYPVGRGYSWLYTSPYKPIKNNLDGQIYGKLIDDAEQFIRTTKMHPNAGNSKAKKNPKNKTTKPFLVSVTVRWGESSGMSLQFNPNDKEAYEGFLELLDKYRKRGKLSKEFKEFHKVALPYKLK